MKFKKDGKVFEDIRDVLTKFRCPGPCGDCNLERWRCSHEWVTAYPAEAARLMGYEVVGDDKQSTTSQEKNPCVSTGTGVGPGSQSSKPLKDWTLGDLKEHCHKNVGENCERCAFKRLCDLYVNADGAYICVPGDWDLTEKPRFTEEEVADARAIVRLFGVTYDRVVKDGDSNLYIDHSEEPFTEPVMIRQIFPSIHPGSSVRLSDIVGGDT